MPLARSPSTNGPSPDPLSWGHFFWGTGRLTAARVALINVMPQLTRRRNLEARDECWHVYYGDVHVGTIAIRTGIPPHEQPWG